MAEPKDIVIQPKRRTARVVSFFVETYRELRRVRWPGRREVVTYTAAALIMCSVMGLLVWGFDVGVSKLMSLIGLV